MKNIKFKHGLLACSLIGFAVSICDIQPAIWSDFGLPIGVIFIGLFLIVNALEKEMALLDDQNHGGHQVEDSNFSQPERSTPVSIGHSAYPTKT